MADGKGFKVVVKINLPPEENYHSGHSVIFQGDSADEVQSLVAPLVGDEQAKFILLRFAEYALGGAAKQALTSGVVEGDAGTTAASGESAPSSPDLASEAVMKALAKKIGKSVEELGELTKAQAAEMLKGGGK